MARPLESAVKKLIQIKKGSRNHHMGDSFTVLRHFIAPDRNFKCYAGKYFAYIHYNGDVYPCWTPPKMGALNCKDVGFRAAFEKIPSFSCHTCELSSLVKANYHAALNVNTIVDTVIRLLLR